MAAEVWGNEKGPWSSGARSASHATKSKSLPRASAGKTKNLNLRRLQCGATFLVDRSPCLLEKKTPPLICC